MSNESDQKKTIFIFHCVNSYPEIDVKSSNGHVIKEVKLPCTGKITELFLLKTFSAGADAVMVMGCPAGECTHLKGNLHAISRVKRTKDYLDELGLNGERLEMRILSREDKADAGAFLNEMVERLKVIGGSPVTMNQ